jgi:adenylosuccinate lyase
MTRPEETYEDPLVSRYATREMTSIFSPLGRFRLWRRMWIALAKAQSRLGLPVTDEQVREMEAHAEDINLADAEAQERKVRHDVMAHVHAFGLQCPSARPIIHLGATSCFVTDNADVLIHRKAMTLLERRLRVAIRGLADFARRNRAVPTLGFTHFQPAQPTTVGKRACLWLQDLLMDLEDLVRMREGLRLRGVKGTTGTQASFLELFQGDHDKVLELERLVAADLGFDRVWPVTGQTYPRKEDARILNVLSGLGQSAHRFANDVRLLSHLREVEEPFETSQIGSSAMAYKRNPMRCERMTALSRHLIVLALDPALTAAEQWLERTLDDSANRRLAIPQAFFAAEACSILLANVGRGLVVHEAVTARHLEAELPFLATEPVLMRAVAVGGDRQALHERIRVHSVEALRRIKEGDGTNDLLERLSTDEAFSDVRDEIAEMADPARLVGRAPEQVDAFLEEVSDMVGEGDEEDGASVEVRV